jgi:hypothetical protein
VTENVKQYHKALVDATELDFQDVRINKSMFVANPFSNLSSTQIYSIQNAVFHAVQASMKGSSDEISSNWFTEFDRVFWLIVVAQADGFTGFADCFKI